MSVASQEKAASGSLKLTGKQKLALLRTMTTSREGDRREGILIRQGRGWFHIGSQGHESLAAAALHLQQGDYVFPHYRDRALVLERGLDTYALALSFFGKKESSSGGRQLPGHHSRRALNIWSMPSPTGSNLLPACGAAWGMRLQGDAAVAVASVGDSGMRQGEFYEAVAFALEKSLPVVFLVEDNGYGISTPTETSNPLRLGLFGRSHVLKADGRSVQAVYETTGKAIQRARSGQGPTVVWLEMDRMCSHSSSDDHRNYRSADAIDQMSSSDPLERLAMELMQDGSLTEERWVKMKEEVSSAVEYDYRSAEKAIDPEPSDVLKEVAGETSQNEDVLFNATDDNWRMIDAVNRVFKDSLAQDKRYIFFGEDIEDPMGGVFKLTQGLSKRFPDRVFNSPLAEGTILGVACGLAAYGMRPVFELQFIDFVGPAWNQLVTNLSTLRWRSMGEWKCPVVIYAPSGAYLPAGGPWHSQSNEAAFAHVPGIRVVNPSSPEDAAGLLHTAMHADDPTVVLLPKHLLRVRGKGEGAVRAVPFGRARVRRQGSDLTVVTWGNCVEKVEQALDQIGDQASVEVIDLRSIMPWDRETVKESLIRTGRLLVVHEDNESCSAGQMVISEMMSNSEVWNAWRASPRLIARPDVHIAYHPNLEEATLPSVSKIVSTILEMTEGGSVVGRSAPTSQPEAEAAADEPRRNGKVALYVPNIGEGLEEARILKFFKEPGDEVKRDEIIYQLETDKAVVDIECPNNGTIVSWEVEADATVRIGSVVGHIETDEEAVTPHHGPSPETVPPVAADPEPAAAAADESYENGRNIGVLTATDSTTFQQLKLRGRDQGGYEEISLSAQQQVLATRLARAARVAVPATIFQDISWERLEAERVKMKKNPETKHITTFALLSWCVAQIVKEHPPFRSALPTQSVFRVYKNVHLGIAVALPTDDLTTAVVEDADLSGLKEYAHRLKERVDLARQGVDQARQPASLILTSITQFEIPNAVPVIVPPAVATLLIGAKRPEVRLDAKGKPFTRSVASFSLTIDHRVMNGAAAGRFLNDVKQKLESVEVTPEML